MPSPIWNYSTWHMCRIIRYMNHHTTTCHIINTVNEDLLLNLLVGSYLKLYEKIIFEKIILRVNSHMIAWRLTTKYAYWKLCADNDIYINICIFFSENMDHLSGHCLLVFKHKPEKKKMLNFCFMLMLLCQRRMVFLRTNSSIFGPKKLFCESN